MEMDDKLKQTSCPNCGYCPHCGRSNPQVTYPSYPWYPDYPYQRYWWQSTSSADLEIMKQDVSLTGEQL